jgi:predicted MFS family arabinose efflux permease
MAAADCARAALHGGVAVLIFTGAASVGLLVVLGGLFGAADAFGRPAYSGLVPQTVPEQALQRGNAVLGGSQNVAEFAGPALATVLLASGGAGYAFALDAATFALSALLVVSLRLPRAAPRRSPAPLRSELAEGLRQVETRPWIWLMLLVAAGLLLAGFAPWLVLGPSVAGEVYGSADAFAWLVAAAGLGTVAGALVGVRLRAASPVLASVTVLGTWPLLLASFGIGAPLPAVGCLAVLAGGAVALANVWWETALARHVPSESLSRVAACDWIASLGLLPVGYLLAGAAAAALGGAFLWLAWRLRREPTPARAALTFHFSLAYLALLFVAMAVDVSI